MRETTPHTNKEPYHLFIFELGFSRVSHLVLFETGLYYDDGRWENPRRWWENHRNQYSKGIPLPLNFFIRSGLGSKIDAVQTGAADHEPPSVVELYGKIDKSGLLYLAAFVGLDEKPVYSTHKESFFVLWRDSSGVIEAIGEKSGKRT